MLIEPMEFTYFLRVRSMLCSNIIGLVFGIHDFKALQIQKDLYYFWIISYCSGLLLEQFN